MEAPPGKPTTRLKSASSRTGGCDRRANHAIRRRPSRFPWGLKASPTAMAEVARSIFADSRARSSSARDFGQALGNDDARGSLDKGKVGEGLREVAEVAAGFDVVLLGV